MTFLFCLNTRNWTVFLCCQWRITLGSQEVPCAIPVVCLYVWKEQLVPLGRCFSFKWSVVHLSQQIFAPVCFLKDPSDKFRPWKGEFPWTAGTVATLFLPRILMGMLPTALQAWWVKWDSAFIFLTGGRLFFQYGKSLSQRSLFPSSLWFFCPGMQQSMLMSGLPALLSLHLGPKRWNPNQILNFQKLWNTLHKLQRTTLTKSLLLVYFLPFFFPFLSQLYFPQCEIQTDLHPGCTLSGTGEMVFGCW